MQKQHKFLLESHLTYKSFDKKIKAVFIDYFLDHKLISFLCSNQILLKDKITKLKTLEKKATTEVSNLLKNSKDRQDTKDKFINLIQDFYIHYIKFYPTIDELSFINKTSSAVKKSSTILLEEIVNDPIYFNYSKAFFEMKETKFAIAREIRNYA